MLQQTPVARVQPVWQEWIDRWPTPADLALAPVAEVLRAWGSLGYPRRALRLQQAAAAICATHGGSVPAGRAELEALPGVGSYTAAAVRCFAFQLRDVALDTNVRRVIGRAVAGQALPAPHLSTAERHLAEALAPADPATAAVWNAAVMELGALVCTAGAPRCRACPLVSSCAWVAASRPPDRWAATRRTQPWHGTDRQVRGKLMALLRSQDSVDPLAVEALGASAAQVERCVASLIADGLARLLPDGSLALPGSEPESAKTRTS